MLQLLVSTSPVTKVAGVVECAITCDCTAKLVAVSAEVIVSEKLREISPTIKETECVTDLAAMSQDTGWGLGFKSDLLGFFRSIKFINSLFS